MNQNKESIAIIVGSAYNKMPYWLSLQARQFSTPYGEATLYHMPDSDPDAYVLFRHGVPHKYLPNQIPFRAHTWALKEVNCGALVVTSSVGVTDPNLPLFQPLLVSDLIMLENRLPDGSTCTMFTEPSEDHAHLIITEGLFNPELRSQLKEMAEAIEWPVGGEVIFSYVGGPRNKTPAENRIMPILGSQVNSMSLGPEIVLANELAIPTAGLVVGHKYSIPGRETENNPLSLEESFERSREAFGKLIIEFLRNGHPVSFGNVLYRYNSK
jgi:5'-methylthioadenosine phosphorylase